MTDFPALVLKEGRDHSLLRRHPWIFSGAVSRIEGAPGSGDTVAVLNAHGDLLAYAAYSPGSKITARVWSFDRADSIGEDFFRRRIESALQLRKTVFSGVLPDAFRLLHAESDFLPGVTCDVYGKRAVCQFSSAGAEKHREVIASVIAGLCAPDGVYERSDTESRLKEGLPLRTGVMLGTEPPEVLSFEENGVRFECNVRTGHKTGFYLDQRMNRLAVQSAASGRTSVLNCFSYTGGFGLAALAGGAEHVLNVDTSAEALSLARRNAALNGFSPDRFETLEADVFHFLRSCRDGRRTFDLIVLDPPKFAESASAVERAARGYKDINLLAMKLLAPGGMLFTFSCSGAMDDALFLKIADSAAADARADFQIVRWLSQGPDHPVSASFPEGRYLKGLAIRKA